MVLTFVRLNLLYTKRIRKLWNMKAQIMNLDKMNIDVNKRQDCLSVCNAVEERQIHFKDCFYCRFSIPEFSGSHCNLFCSFLPS